MNKKLLTNVVSDLVNKYALSQEYGVSLVNIPDFDYIGFASRLSDKKIIEVFFLGFAFEDECELKSSLPIREHVKYSFSVEEAEISRNTGDETVFRVLVIKRVEMEKISSLRWFPEIGLEKVYMESCSYIKRKLKGTNSVIEALIQTLRCKPIRSLLSFERVLDYLEILFETPSNELPDVICENYYKLGLLADKNIANGNPNKDDFVLRIKRNHAIVERISNLEQTERQSITNYYAKSSGNRDVPRWILSYYKTKNIELLKNMELEEIERCLKAVKEKPVTSRRKRRTPVVKPTVLAAQLVFDGNIGEVDSVLEQIGQSVDGRNNNKKSERVEVDYEGSKVQVKAEPLLLKSGKKVCFCIVSLHPYLKEVVIDRNTEFYEELKQCMDRGLRLYAYTTRLEGSKLKIEHEIPVSFTENI